VTRSPGLFALTARRFATPRSAALVIVVLTLIAAFVIAAAPRALVAVVRAEVAHQIDQVPPTSRDLTTQVTGVPLFGPPTDPSVADGWDDGAAEVFGVVGQALADNREDFEPALQPLAGPAELAEYTDPITLPVDGIPADAPIGVIQLLAEPALGSSVDLVEGGWPGNWTGDGPIEIVLSAAAAEVMQWDVGQTRDAYTLVGTVEAIDPDAGRWVHLPTALTATVFDDGNRRPTATSAAWVAPETWALIVETVGGFGRAYTTAWYPIDGAEAVDADPQELLSAMRAATSASVPLDDSGQLRATFSSDVVGVLASALARANSASAILAVAAVGPLAVGVALVVLASALMVRRRRADLALMSARGAPIARLRRLLFGEGLILGMPAAVAGAGVGIAVTVQDAGPVPTVIAVLVGLAPAIALAAALRPAVLTRSRADLDAPVRSRMRGIAETIVVLLAVLAVVQLVVRGVGPATDGIDPLVVVAPLLATVALALIVVRLHPAPIAAALRVARRGRGVVGLVGAARNLRDPAAGTTAVLAMLVAVAIAVFSSVVLATVDRGAVVAAQRAVGADIQLAGPYFDTDKIERMREVDGVVDAVGVLRGAYLTVSGAGGAVSASTLVTDVARLAAVQQGMVGAVPAAITPESVPIQIIESTALAEAVGAGSAEIADTPAAVVATMERLLGITGSVQFALVDVADYRAIAGAGFFPRNVFVDVSDDADPVAVADALGDIVGGAHSVRLLAQSTAEIQASPAVTALRVVLLAALGFAVALSVVAILLVAGVSQDARSRVIALLRSMGLDRRRTRGIVAWEFAPLGITALVGGVLLGAVLPLLVVLSIDLRPFTGGGAQPSLAVDPVLSGALIAVVVVALALAVVIGVLGARTTSMATVLRTEED
jgi:putative ABC transport system permease protein